MKMNENFKEENEAQNATIQELNDKVSELEQIKLQNDRLILTLRGKLEDALQAQESYKSLVKRIQIS